MIRIGEIRLRYRDKRSIDWGIGEARVICRLPANGRNRAEADNSLDADLGIEVVLWRGLSRDRAQSSSIKGYSPCHLLWIRRRWGQWLGIALSLRRECLPSVT